MRLRSLACLVVIASAGTAFADEGMWTFNNFPSDKVKAKYGWSPTQQWLDHVRLSSVRIAGGCSASFVSAEGLVMTNHHCAHPCIEQLSTQKKDYVKAGFFAKELKDEAKCPEIEINQLVEISDVTKLVQDATKAVEESKFNDVQRAKIAELEKACATGDDVRCEVISLYRGGHFDLYKYRRFQDVRLAFAPEFDIAFFGGDPDNFMFPRYALDFAFLRIYGVDGKPAKTEHYLSWSKENAKDGDLTFVAGNPGGTSRLLTVSQLESARDSALPTLIARLAEARGLLTEYANRGAEQKRHSSEMLFGIENALKANRGRHAALADRKFFASKVAAEAAFKTKVNADANLKKSSAGVWDAIGVTVDKSRIYKKTYSALEHGVRSELYYAARTLVRAADELSKPNGDRLKEFAESRLPQLKQMLFSKAPIHDEFEVAMLTFSLTKMREDLGADHPVVKQVFGMRSPEEIAKEAVKGTKLKDLKLRTDLFADGKGKDKIDSSKDPMILLAKAIDPAARVERKRWEDEIDGPMKKQGEQLAKAYFAVYGKSTYPDATFTPRVSYGIVKGWSEGEVELKPVTNLAGAFDRATGRAPFALPKSWLDTKGKLALETPFNVVTTNDIIGGNSGSPMVNKEGEVVGLVFDGNIHSLGGDYGFDEAVNRTVSVHSAAMLETLDKVYNAKRLVLELKPAASTPKAGSP